MFLVSVTTERVQIKVYWKNSITICIGQILPLFNIKLKYIFITFSTENGASDSKLAYDMKFRRYFVSVQIYLIIFRYDNIYN
jgi:hypothetical protein